MDQRSNSRLSLFLMELIVAIMFFSLSAAVCVRLFASAHILSDDTKSLSNASIWTQNLAEAFEGKNGHLAGVAELFPDALISYSTADPKTSDGSIVLFFDDNWERVNNLVDASYLASLTITTKEARGGYKDVTDYDVELIGKAAVGDISILDIRNIENPSPDIPVDPENIIMNVKVDTYIGKGAE